ncbi:hypothetical protein CGJ93_22770 [Vibrio parahaemolyticus]|nr:hypothetical protein CGJ93_22770 [Vibrio parahaemolyticus]
MNISPKHSALAAFSSLATNAALRCEQRYHETKPYHRKHKTQRWNEKCRALGITLKCFVSYCSKRLREASFLAFFPVADLQLRSSSLSCRNASTILVQ